jgi:serine/threonine protein kinase
LVYVKILNNAHIVQLLFAYEDKCSQTFNLVFPYYCYDLYRILYNKELPSQVSMDAFSYFPGSNLDHWLWKGLLDIIEAIELFHNLIKMQGLPSDHILIGGCFNIKSANIVCDNQGNLLLADLGEAYFKEVRPSDSTLFTVMAGTLPYQPPPMSLHSENTQRDLVEFWKWSRAYNIWSLACVLLESIVYIYQESEAVVEFEKARKIEDVTSLRTSRF